MKWLSQFLSQDSVSSAKPWQTSSQNVYYALEQIKHKHDQGTISKIMSSKLGPKEVWLISNMSI